ncbi:MAG: SpaA isopeptide-forming pilin-related protein, partial [Anaerococcus sp.]|nr:SpaA isopeptide-forming pilin-related protein [Anaerococcus sp.]
NVIGDRNPYKKVNPKTLNYNWITTNFQGGNITNWAGEGTEPRQVLDRVKIYRTEANVRVINDGPLTTLVNDYMPQSMGFRAEQEPNIYRPVFNASVDPNQNATISQNGITLIYDKGQINPNGKLIDNKNQPLKIKMPSINNGEGYVIEQRFKIPDIDAFNNKWRAFVMNNGNLKSAFASGANKSFAKGDQTGGETPKYYKEDVGVINKKYTAGQFKIIKSNESDKSKLGGATFELTDANNKTIYRTSDNNGELSFTNLAPGKYTLKETKAPDNFVKSEKRWAVNVYSDGSVRITQIGILGSDESYFGNNENIIIMPVSNKPTGTQFRVYKKDSDGKPLQGAKFVIKNKEGTEVIKSGESNNNGVVEFKDLIQGTYIIEESEAPKGYNKLGKKWVLVIDKDGNKKVYNYRESSGTTTLNSILEKPNVNWVDVAGRSLDGWNLYDNRYTGWTGNNVDPFKLGTRIVGINRKDKYVIQRYVINPEAASIGATSATIHREKPEYPNMDWYSGALNSGEEIQVFKLNKPVTGVISDIRLAEYGATEITSQVGKDTDKSRFGQPQRLKLDFPATDKPLVIDVKVPYKEESGGVGTGMDWTENGTTYWKSDYYERASVIKEASPVVSNDGNIVGSYISEGSLDVTNEFKTFDFKLKKVKDNDNSKAIEGAKFKLTGPGEGGEEREITTGKDGIISFDKLRPGIYKLEEIEPAPGYEKSNVDWTVRITSDGKKYIKVNKKADVTEENTKLVKPNTNGTNTNTPVRTLAYRGFLENNSRILANKNSAKTPSLN